MDFVTMEEAELIRLCVEGDKQAMDTLIQSHWERVYHHCLRMVQEEASAEDLTQETFIHAFTHLASFQQRARFSTWVWRIAHNLCLNYLRRRKQEYPLIEEIVPATPETVEAPIFAHLEEAMEVLDEKHREVFQLYDIEHMPQKEIAEKLGIPHGTVRSRLHYARLKIREYFQAHPPE